MIGLSLIAELQTEGRLVSVRRARFGDSIRGFVTRCSPDFVVLALVDGSCAFDGTAIVRLRDVTYVEWGTDRLRARASVVAESPSSPDPVGHVELTSWTAVVRSVSSREPVLAFHCEDLDPNRFDVGMNVRIDEDWVRAENLTVDGTVEGEFAFDPDELTRLDFGGGYERGLFRMLQASRRVC